MDVLAAIRDPDRLPPLTRAKAQRAVNTIGRTLDLYGPPAVAFSFNGGKDSTVILHLLRAAMAARVEEENGEPPAPSLSSTGVRSFIFDRPADDFPEVRAFVEEADAEYGLGLEHLDLGGTPKTGGGGNGGGMAGVLGEYLRSTGVRAVLLGTRRGDPNAAGQAEFCPSSPGWPPFLRVNPALEWGFSDVWAFLDGAGASYCPLYDLGFTSLGSVGTTHRNAALLRPDGSYGPARELADGREERAGRDGKRKAGGGENGSAAAALSHPSSRPPSAPTRTAAVLIVGDELLAARVEEGNAGFLCAKLHALGWRVARVVVLPDEAGAIAAEVASCAASWTVVLIAGGVGPTEDDVTLAAVAAAFSVPVTRDPDLEARLRSYFPEETISEAHLKMADAPEGVQALEVVSEGGDTDAHAHAATAPRPSPFPLLAFRNTYILPGVPALLRRKWPALEAALSARFGACAPFSATSIRLTLKDESAVGPALTAASRACGGRARVGCYPLDPPSPEDGATVVVVVEGKDGAAVAAGVAAARGALPDGCVFREVEGGAV